MHSRRAFLLVPIGVAGAVTLWWTSERQLPDPALQGAGPVVDLTLFNDQGQAAGAVHVRKIQHTEAEWRKLLSADEFAITRGKATEFAFSNRYWNAHQPGIYRCVCCGNAVFRSKEKFDSGTGWPSFWAPIAPENIYTATDRSLAIERTEVLCQKCDAHLGHVFDDGPPPTGLRYCLNSGALRFVKLE